MVFLNQFPLFEGIKGSTPHRNSHNQNNIKRKPSRNIFIAIMFPKEEKKKKQFELDLAKTNLQIQIKKWSHAPLPSFFLINFPFLREKKVRPNTPLNHTPNKLLAQNNKLFINPPPSFLFGKWGQKKKKKIGFFKKTSPNFVFPHIKGYPKKKGSLLGEK